MENLNVRPGYYIGDGTQTLDPYNPFSNPTEERHYTPDYGDILPQIRVPGCRIPLLPTTQEAHSIHYFYNIIGLMILFAFLLFHTLRIALTFGILALLQLVDVELLGTLSENYAKLAQQYMTDSMLSTAIHLLSYLGAALGAFGVGCKLCRQSVLTYFKPVQRPFPRLLSHACILFAIHWLITTLFGTLSFADILPDARTATIPNPIQLPSAIHQALYLFFFCLGKPLADALLYQGLVLKNFSRISQRFGILMSALFYALSFDTLPQVLAAFPMGLLLAYWVISTNSIQHAILASFLCNLLQILICYIADFGSIGYPIAIGAEIVLFVIGTIWFYFHIQHERLPADTPHQSMRCAPLMRSAPVLLLAIVIALCSIPFGRWMQSIIP